MRGPGRAEPLNSNPTYATNVRGWTPLVESPAYPRTRYNGPRKWRYTPDGRSGSCMQATVTADVAPVDPKRVGRFCNALGNRVRFRLMLQILDWPDDDGVSMVELIGLFRLSGATLTYHLRLLRQAGLVIAEKRGHALYYRADRLGFAEAAGDLLKMAIK